MGAGDGARGCLKTGCLGCAALLGVGILAVVVLVVLALSASRIEPRFEDVERSQAPPPPVQAEAGADAEDRAGHSPPGRVILDVGAVEFEVRPGEPGSAIRVEGRYDTARYELDERLDSEGETGWSYHLTFRRRGIAASLVSSGESSARLVLFLPAGPPIALEAHIGLGESNLELGGLFLTEAVLDFGIGSHRVSFSEPLPAPMGKLDISGSIGELTLVSVGNASPETVELSHRIGVLNADLRGAWVRDARIDVRCELGECGVRVPPEVELDLTHASVMLGEESLPRPAEIRSPAERRPTLHLSVTSRIGEVRVER